MLEAERLEKLCAATEVQPSGAQVVQMVCAKHGFHGLQTFQSRSDLVMVVSKTLSCQERFAFVSVVMSYCPGVPFEG